MRMMGLLALGLVGCTCGPLRAVPEGPNVLVLVLDTVRADRLSTYGYGRPTTPALDAFAAQGRVFERAVSPGMWTVPSHASLFTGLHVRSHGAHAGHKWLDDSHHTLAELLYAHGWDTWLFSANPFLGDHTNLAQGYAERHFPWDDRFVDAATAATMAKLDARDASQPLGPRFSGHKVSTGRDNDRVKDAGVIAADALIDWVGGRMQPSRPWHAVINYMEAHTPRIPSLASRRALFDAEAIEAQLAVDQSHGRLLTHLTGVDVMPDDEVALVSDVYDASLRELDVALAHLFGRLQDEGLLSDTLVIITGDHGEHLGEHGLMDHKFSVYNPLVRVPLILRYPRKVPAGRDRTLVSTLDVYATVAKLLGLAPPEGLSSEDLLAPRARQEAFTELVEATPLALKRIARAYAGFDPKPFLLRRAAVEVDDAKCIEREDGHRELFNLPEDPLETKDVSADDPERTARICDRVRAWQVKLPRHEGVRPVAPALDDDMRRRLETLGYVE